MNFAADVQVTGSQVYDFGTVQQFPLGTRCKTRDGRMFRYMQAGAVLLVPGNVIQGPAILVNHLALTPSAAALGATQVVATLGATAAAENLYADGYLQVDTTPGNGYVYQVDSHLAVLSSGVITVNLRKDDPVQVALTTSSRVGLLQNQYKGGIQAPVTTATGIIIGVAVSAIAINNYGWVQTHGIASPLINGTPALGANVLGISGTTAGSVDIETAAPLIVSQRIGRMAQIGVSTKNNFVFLTID